MIFSEYIHHPESRSCIGAKHAVLSGLPFPRKPGRKDPAMGGMVIIAKARQQRMFFVELDFVLHKNTW